MMELLKDMLILFGRIVTILPLLLFVTMMMGKRSIAELPVFDFLVIVVMGAVVGADIADMDISHIHTAVAIVLIGLFQVLVTKWKISNRTIGRWITFEPTVVIRNGQFLVGNLSNIRYSIDNILQMLREKDVFDIQDVDTGIVEANGTLTVHKKPEKETVTIADLGLRVGEHDLPYPVIVEGKLYEDVLQALQISRESFDEALRNLQITNLRDVFFASVNRQLDIHVSLYGSEQSAQNTPPLKH
jgi:uncharacterized membrane protein YcaP (DUF421 family)